MNLSPYRIHTEIEAMLQTHAYLKAIPFILGWKPRAQEHKEIAKADHGCCLWLGFPSWIAEENRDGVSLGECRVDLVYIEVTPQKEAVGTFDKDPLEVSEMIEDLCMISQKMRSKPSFYFMAFGEAPNSNGETAITHVLSHNPVLT